MKCPLCGALTATAVEGLYHYTQSGLSWVYLDGVEQVHCPECDDTLVSIPNEDKLLEVIAKTILEEMRPLQAQEIRFLRSLLNWTQDRLASELALRRLAVVNWESGKAKVGFRNDLVLRAVWLRAFLEMKREDGCGVLKPEHLTKLTEMITKLGDAVAMMKKGSPGPVPVSIDVKTRVVTETVCC